MDLSNFEKIQRKEPLGKVSILYLGRFYKTLRNPKYLLDVMEKIPDVIVDFYTEGQCEQLVKEYADKNGSNINIHPFVSPNRILELYSKTDILLSMGNNSSEFQPSKIYEYISTGKPIINFYYGDNKDYILELYPLAIQCRIDSDVIRTREAICQFIIDTKNKYLTREKIEKIYNYNSPISIRKLLTKHL